MDISKGNKILLLILLAVFAVWMFSGKKPNKNDNISNKYMSNNLSNNFDDQITSEIEKFDPETTNNMISDNDSSYSANSEISNDSESLNGVKNLACNSHYESFQEENVSQNKYKSSSFSKGERGSKSSDLDQFFEGSYPNNPNNNNGFSPMTNNNIGAAYTPGKPEKLSDKDKFNPDSLLPREKNSDWVDDPYEDVTVKSSMIGNIFRPVGINSVQSTKKISSHDMRGLPKAPKFNVSPWNNSSVDGDTNIRNESLCL